MAWYLSSRVTARVFRWDRDVRRVLDLDRERGAPAWSEFDYRDALAGDRYQAFVAERGRELLGVAVVASGLEVVVPHFLVRGDPTFFTGFVLGRLVWESDPETTLVPESALSLQLALKSLGHRAEAIEYARFPGGEAAYRFVRRRCPDPRAGAVSAGSNIVALRTRPGS